jgi:hypothetical protein
MQSLGTQLFKRLLKIYKALGRVNNILATTCRSKLELSNEPAEEASCKK